MPTINALNRFKYQQMDLAGGQNDKVDPLKIGANQFEKIRDFIYDEIGNLTLIGKTTPLNIDTGDYEHRLLHKFRLDDGTEHLIACTSDGKIKALTGLTLTDLKTGLPTNKYFSCETYKNKCYVAMGAGKTQVIDANEGSFPYPVRDIGCPKPASSCTAAAGAAGDLTGKYKYGVTFVYKFGQSAVSPLSNEVNVTNQKINVSGIPTGGPYCIGRWLYRTTAGGETLNRLTYIDDNTTTTYEDNISDGGLEGIEPYDGNNIPPEDTSIVFYYKGYMYYAVGNKLYYSQLMTPDEVQVSDFDEFMHNITGIERTLNPDMMIVLTEGETYAYSGTSPHADEDDTMVREVIDKNIGCIAPNSIRRAGSDLLFLANDRRVHRLSRVVLASTTTFEPKAVSDVIDGTMQHRLNPDRLKHAHALYYDRKYFLYVSAKDYGSENLVLIADLMFENSPWVTAEPMAVSASGIWKDEAENSCMVISQAGTPVIYRFEPTSQEAGRGISPLIRSRQIHVGQPFNRKIFYKLRILAEASVDFFFTVKVFITKAGKTKIITRNVQGITVTGDSSIIWGQGVWGQGMWGSNVEYTNAVVNIGEPIYLGTDGEILQFEIYNVSASTKFTLKGFELEGRMMRTQN